MSLVAEKVNIKDFDFSRMSFTDVKTANKGKYVDVLYNNRPLSIQLPRMPVHVWQNTGNSAYAPNENQASIDLVFKEKDTRPPVAHAFKTLQDMDERICEEATINALTWGISKKNITVDAMKVFHHEMIRMPTSEKYHPALKVKVYINKNDQSIGCKVFDKDKHELKRFPLDSLRGASVAAVLLCTGIWTCAGRFSVAWRVSQLRVFEREARPERIITDDDMVDFRTIDMSKVTYSAPNSMGSTGKMVYINYNSNPIVVNTPKLSCPFGMSRFAPETGGAKYSIDLSFKEAATDADAKAFKDFVDSLDIKVQKDVASNGWFAKDTVYQPICKQNNPEYPAVMKLNLPTVGDAAKFKMFDDSGNEFEFDPSMIHDFKGAKISCMIQCSGIWQNGAKYGVSFKVIKMNITPAVSGNEKMDDEDDEEMVESKVAAMSSDEDDDYENDIDV